MPVGTLLALTIAVVLGFILGLLEALDKLTYHQTLHIAEVGLAIVLLVALAGVIAERGPARERVVASLLRIGLSGTLFAFIFEGMRLLLKIGNVGGALASWLWAGVLAILLARIAPATAPRPETGPHRTPQPAAPRRAARQPAQREANQAS